MSIIPCLEWEWFLGAKAPLEPLDVKVSESETKKVWNSMILPELQDDSWLYLGHKGACISDIKVLTNTIQYNLRFPNMD